MIDAYCNSGCDSIRFAVQQNTTAMNNNNLQNTTAMNNDSLQFVRHNENFIEAFYRDKRIMTYEKGYGYRYDEDNSGIMGEYSNLVGSFDSYCSEKEFQEAAKSCVQGLEHKDWEESGGFFKSKVIPELCVEFNVSIAHADVEFEAYYKEDRIFHGCFNGDTYWLDDETCLEYDIPFDSDSVYVESCDIAKILSAANEYGKAILENQKERPKARSNDEYLKD